MRTIRRLYFYTVVFVSLEVVLWGLIGLARSIFCTTGAVCNVSALLARSLALILVGLPVFGLHWWLAERFARQDEEEHASGIRAFFLYGVLLATLIPILQNVLSLLDRLALQAVGLSSYHAFLGPNQTWSDNLIAVVMNAVVAAYFVTVLRADWKAIQAKESFADLRRLYRHVWLIYSLVLVVAAVQQLLHFILNIFPQASGIIYRASGAHGVALALVGVPVWFFVWKTMRDSLAEGPERDSLLRLGVLYLLSLAGVITVLSSGGVIVYVLLRLIFGEQMSTVDLLRNITGPLSIAIPLAGIWAYYGHWLGRAMSETPDAPRRAGMRRLYAYLLAVVGLGASFIGLAMLLSFVVDLVISSRTWGTALRSSLSASLATLVVGLPLWWSTWRPMQAEALAEGDSGDHARRSIVRKVYLYLALFVGVIGGMISAVSLLYTLLVALLSGSSGGLLRNALDAVQLLFLFAGLGLYHGLTLGRDGKIASRALADRHAAYPVWIFDTGDGFGEAALAALRKQAPHLPAAVQTAAKPAGKGAAPKAVILPSDLALDPPEPLRKWLAKFDGRRLVVPRAAPGWFVVGQSANLPFNQTALAVRQLAEGQEVRPQGGTPGWQIVLYILAALIGLPIVISLIGALARSFF